MTRRLLLVLAAIPFAGAFPACAGGACCRRYPPAGAPPPPAVAILSPTAPGGVPPDLPGLDPGQRYVTVEMRLITPSPDDAKALYGAGLDDGALHARGASAEDVRRLLGASTNGVPVRILSSPRVTTAEGQRANVQIMNTISYVRDVEVEVSDPKGVIANPIVATVAEGITLEFTVDAEDAGPAYALDLRATLRRLDKPLAVESLAIAGGAPVQVQRPHVDVRGLDGRFGVADGGSVLLGCLAPGLKDYPGPLLALLTVTRTVFDGPPVPKGSDLGLAPSNYRPPEEPATPAAK